MDPTNQQRDNTPTHFFNPLKDTVKVGVRDDKNVEQMIEIPSMAISTHPKWLADVLVKHLVDAIINERKLGIISPEKWAELQEETEVSL